MKSSSMTIGSFLLFVPVVGHWKIQCKTIGQEKERDGVNEAIAKRKESEWWNVDGGMWSNYIHDGHRECPEHI